MQKLAVVLAIISAIYWIADVRKEGTYKNMPLFQRIKYLLTRDYGGAAAIFAYCAAVVALMWS